MAGRFTFIDAFSRPLKDWGSSSPHQPPPGWGEAAPPHTDVGGGGAPAVAGSGDAAPSEAAGERSGGGHVCWSWGEEGEAVRGLLEVIHRELGALDAGSGGGGGCCLVVDSLSSLLDLVEAPGDPQGAFMCKHLCFMKLITI